MLAPRAENRPSASGVIERTRLVKAYLQPELLNLNLKVPAQVTLENSYSLRIQAQGRGLPPHSRWLNMRVDDVLVLPNLSSRPEIASLESRSGYSWLFTMPAFSKTGEHKINLHAVIRGQKTQVPAKTIRVHATPDQLWRKKQYIEALKRDPKTKWLDELEARTVTAPDFKLQYKKILEQLRHIHPNHADINGRYWD